MKKTEERNGRPRVVQINLAKNCVSERIRHPLRKQKIMSRHLSTRSM